MVAIHLAKSKETIKMEHIMKLFESDFDNLKSGSKKREYRLNDDKRRLV